MQRNASVVHRPRSKGGFIMTPTSAFEVRDFNGQNLKRIGLREQESMSPMINIRDDTG